MTRAGSPERWRFSRLAALIGLVLILPSANTQVFSGLPLSHPFAYVLGISLLPLMFSRSLRRTFGRWLSHWPSRLRGAFIVTLLTALVLKVVLFASGDYVGLRGCYRSPGTGVSAGNGACESSYENALRRFGSTRVDKQFDFGPGSWNLSFFNSNRFNIYTWVKGNAVRDRLPLRVVWEGSLTAPGPRFMKITYVGEGSVAVGERGIRLNPSYSGSNQVSIAIPSGQHGVLIEYLFNDGSRVGAPLPGPNATFHASWTDQSDRAASVTLGRNGHARPLLRGLARLDDALVIAAGLALAAFYVRLFAHDRWPAMSAIGLLGIVAWWPPTRAVTTGATNSVLFLVCVPVLMYVLRGRHRRVLVGGFFMLVALAWVAFSPAYHGVSTVQLRGSGSDWLTYESLARSILDARSLVTNEPVFYYQPLFRYIRFFEHLLMGDGDLLILVTGFGALTFSVMFGLRRSSLRREPRSMVAAATAGVLMLALVTILPGALWYLILGASEYPTWVMLPTALPALLVSRSRRASLWSTAMLAASAITRINEIPGIVTIFGVGLYKHRRRPYQILAAAALFSAICLLPLAHNLHYGGRPVLFTRDQALWNRPAKLLHNLADPATREALFLQSRSIVALDFDATTSVAAHGLQLLWLSTVVWMLATRRLTMSSVALAAVPVMFLGVLVFYPADVRHVIAGHLMMGSVSVLLVRQALIDRT